MDTFLSHSELDTINFATTFASKLNKNNIIILSGDLGSGKTKFVEGILNYFNIADEISSPTFTIVNEYITKTINIFHFDLYRLNNIDDFYAIGGDEYLENGICIFEWGELLESYLKKDYIKIYFNKIPNNENMRELKIKEVTF